MIGEVKLINRLTGKEATPAEYYDCKMRAQQILRNPYSDIDQIEWAMNFVGDAPPFQRRETDKRPA